MAYLFICIAIGLGTGADQRIITIIAVIALIVIIILRKTLIKTKKSSENLYLSIKNQESQNVSINDVIIILKKYFESINLTRFDEAEDRFEVTFQISSSKFDQIENAKNELKNLSKSIEITFTDISDYNA